MNILGRFSAMIFERRFVSQDITLLIPLDNIQRIRTKVMELREFLF